MTWAAIVGTCGIETDGEGNLLATSKTRGNLELRYATSTMLGLFEKINLPRGIGVLDPHLCITEGSLEEESLGGVDLRRGVQQARQPTSSFWQVCEGQAKHRALHMAAAERKEMLLRCIAAVREAGVTAM